MDFIWEFFNYFLIFFIYSVLGWFAETIYVSILKKKFVNRGFLVGPYCPIYGCGSLMMILYLEQYKNNFLTVFLLGMFICCFLEYITSYVMEKIFKTRWWDYSNKLFNLNGRICGENALLFGMGGLIIIYFVNPFVGSFLDLFSSNLKAILAIIFFIIFVIDTVLSFNIINKLKRNLNTMNSNKDSTQELKVLVGEVINDKLENNKARINVFQRRIIRAFPDINIEAFINNNKKSIRNLFRK